MLTLEECEYDDLQQLRERENYWIKQLKSNLNSQEAIQDKNYEKKRYKKNKKKILENCDKYREENKEKILEKFECQCGGKYTYKNKSRHLKTPKHQSYLSSKVI